MKPNAVGESLQHVSGKQLPNLSYHCLLASSCCVANETRFIPSMDLGMFEDILLVNRRTSEHSAITVVLQLQLIVLAFLVVLLVQSCSPLHILVPDKLAGLESV